METVILKEDSLLGQEAGKEDIVEDEVVEGEKEEPCVISREGLTWHLGG